MRPLLHPLGPVDTEVVDPDVLAQDFQQAEEIADNTTQYQWKRDGVDDVDLLGVGGHVRVDGLTHTGVMLTSNGVAPFIPDEGGSSAAPFDLWKIPYNRGYCIVGSTPATLTWTSEYPEMIEVYASWQYVRRGIPDPKGLATAWDAYWAAEAGRDPRVQIRIRFDGTVQPGSGPGNYAEDGLARGTGLSSQACASGCKVIIFSAPGPHQLDLVAAQTSARAASEGSANQAEKDGYETTGPIEGITIGSYTFFYIAHRKGGKLTR